MKLSPVGIMIVSFGAIIAIVFWVVGYFVLPNADTHRSLSANPQIATSVTPTSNQAGGTGANATPWYTLDSAPKTLDLDLNSDTSSNPMNFRGYSAGALKISVPVGWTVKVHYTNLQQNVSHSVGFVQWADRLNPSGQFTDAFSGSTGPSDKFHNGVAANQPYDFSFVADKAGQYALVCGVPGHAAGGMWDEFDVDATGTAPTITTSQGTVTVGGKS